MAKGNPKDVKAQAKADADQEIAWREEKELKKKKQKAAESFQAGSLLYKQRDYAAAVQKLSISISMRPEMARYYYARGNCYSKLDDWQRAQVDYSSAIEKETKVAAYYENRGMARPVACCTLYVTCRRVARSMARRKLGDTQARNMQ